MNLTKPIPFECNDTSTWLQFPLVMSRSDNPREGDIPKCWLCLCNWLFCSVLSSGKLLLICQSETHSAYTAKRGATSRAQLMAVDESPGSWNISISFVMKRPFPRALKETWLCYPVILMWAECEVCVQMAALFRCQMVKGSLVYLGHQCVHTETGFVHHQKKAFICHPSVREREWQTYKSYGARQTWFKPCLYDLLSLMPWGPATQSPCTSFSLYICKPEKQYPLLGVVVRIKQVKGLIWCLTLKRECLDAQRRGLLQSLSVQGLFYFIA